MNKLDAIQAFITVTEEASFASASKKLKISSPAISRQIAALEKSLGVLLLQRTTRKLMLTDAGEIYFHECKKILADLKLVDESITRSQKEASGVLHVLSNRYFAEQYLLPRLKQFMIKNPKLHLKLELAERFPDLSEESIDIIFGISMEGPPNLVQKQVASTRYVLCASPQYIKSAGMPKHPNDLKMHHYITHSMRKPDNVIPLDKKRDVMVNPYLSFNDCAAMLSVAINGMGLVRLHDYIVKDALMSGKLIEILPQYHQKAIPVFLYYAQNKYLHPKIRKFIDFFT